jgi:hypothetical protein
MLFKSKENPMVIKKVGEVREIEVGRWITVKWRKSGRVIIHDGFMEQNMSVDAADIDDMIAALQATKLIRD